MKVVLQDGIKDCGICCLLSIIRHYGGNMSKEYLREVTGTNRFNRFECVLNFFKMVIADNADIRPDIPYTYEYLVKLKNEYLLDNFDKISSRCDTVDSEDKKEYNETIDKALLKLNVKKEFRAKMLTKIREFGSGDSETNS